jgi:hypothetical protein
VRQQQFDAVPLVVWWQPRFSEPLLPNPAVFIEYNPPAM